MQPRQSSDQERNKKVEGEKSRQGRVLYGEPAPEPGNERRPKIRKGGEKVGNHGGASEAYLPPG